MSTLLTIHTSCFGGFAGPGGSQLMGNCSFVLLLSGDIVSPLRSRCPPSWASIAPYKYSAVIGCVGRWRWPAPLICCWSQGEHNSLFGEGGSYRTVNVGQRVSRGGEMSGMQAATPICLPHKSLKVSARIWTTE